MKIDFIKKLFAAKSIKTNTASSWFSNQANLESLRDILTSETFVTACNLLLDSKRITDADLFHKSPILLPLRAAQLSGYTNFIKDLEALAKAPNEFVQSLPDEWSHITSENPYNNTTEL